MTITRDRAGKADHPALLVWFDDDHGTWAAGILQITDDLLRWKRAAGQPPVRAYNRDNKRKLSDSALPMIRWLWGGVQTDLPTNLLLHLDPAVRDRIFSAANRWPFRSGQKRINQLFKEVNGRIIGRQTILTVAQQDDAPKRARDARLQLRDEGYLVLGHLTPHPQIARRLSLTRPVKGEWIAVRVTQVDMNDPRPKVFLENRWWGIARPHEPTVQAPDIPYPRDAHYLDGPSTDVPRD